MIVGVDAVGQRLVREHEPVAQDVGGDVEHVLRQHVACGRAAARARAAGGDEAERGAGAGAVRDERREVGEAVASAGHAWRARGCTA